MGERRSVIAQSSLTYAYEGGIRVQIIRLSGVQTQRGCGYGLSVAPHDLDRSVLLLRQSGAFVGEIIR